LGNNPELGYDTFIERKRNERLSGQKRKKKRGKEEKRVFIARILYGYTDLKSYTN